MYSVLYVDDEPDLLELGQVFLQKYWNLSVTTVSSPEEAFHYLKISTFDIIISDYQMPTMDGITFLKNLRKSQFYEPFILFTGKGREEVVIDAINNGADFYLQKGGPPKSQFTELFNMIQKAVGKRRAELELQRVSYQSKAIINHLPDPTFAINEQRVIIAWNKEMESLTGFHELEMIGRNLSEYSQVIFGMPRLSLADYILSPEIPIQKWYYHIHSDARTVTAETQMDIGSLQDRTVWIKASPLYDEHDCTIGAIETLRDITIRKELELELQRKYEELASSYEEIAAQNEEIRASFDEIEKQKDLLSKSERKFRGFIEHLPDGVIIHHNDHIQYVNPMAAHILGYSDPAELTGVGSLDVVHPRCRDQLSYRISRTGTIENPFVKEFFLKKDGSEVPVEVAAISMSMEDSISVMTIFRDITKEFERKTALLQAQNKLKILSSITRHDIKNELATIMAIVDLVSSGDIPESEAELLKRAINPCKNILDQLQTTFEYQTIGILEPNWFYLRSLCYNAAKYHRVEPTIYSFIGENVQIFADPLIEKVFENLIDNTIRHGKGVQSVRFRSERRNGDLYVLYEDDGGGVPDSEKHKIFEEGFGKNTGLGLFLIKEILAMTGISICECGEHGKGVRFEMYIPQGKWRI